MLNLATFPPQLWLVSCDNLPCQTQGSIQLSIPHTCIIPRDHFPITHPSTKLNSSLCAFILFLFGKHLLAYDYTSFCLSTKWQTNPTPIPYQADLLLQTLKKAPLSFQVISRGRHFSQRFVWWLMHTNLNNEQLITPFFLCHCPIKGGYWRLHETHAGLETFEATSDSFTIMSRWRSGYKEKDLVAFIKKWKAKPIRTIFDYHDYQCNSFTWRMLYENNKITQEQHLRYFWKRNWQSSWQCLETGCFKQSKTFTVYAFPLIVTSHNTHMTLWQTLASSNLLHPLSHPCTSSTLELISPLSTYTLHTDSRDSGFSSVLELRYHQYDSILPSHSLVSIPFLFILVPVPVPCSDIAFLCFLPVHTAFLCSDLYSDMSCS